MAEAFLAEKVAGAEDAEVYQVVVHVGTDAIGATRPADVSAETPLCPRRRIQRTRNAVM